MKVLTTAAEINEQLIRLITDCSSFQIAVAWASIGFDAFKLLVKNHQKIEKMVVGTHFFQTHPQFIETFRTNLKVRFVTDTKGVFHPKVYVFDKADGSWECLVGSPNFTNSAISKNDEMAVLLTCEDQGAAVAISGVKASIVAYWKRATALTLDQYESYLEAWNRKQPVLKEVQSQFVFQKPAKPVPQCTWEEYFDILKQRSGITPTHHNIEERLRVIRAVQSLLSKHQSFGDLDRDERNKVAGTLHHANGIIDGVNYHWFGSMWGARQFKPAIKENNPNISLALDAIPATGAVTRKDYMAFVERYRKAFPNGGDGVGTATRLLAMKRPDVFVCLDSKNRTLLCKDFDIRGTVDYKKYWDSIIQPVMASLWWGTSAPQSTLEQEVWKARVAFLDCVFYDGTALTDG